MSTTINDAPALNAPTPRMVADANGDPLLGMMMALGAEVSALSDRIDCALHVLAQKGLVSPAELDAAIAAPERAAQSQGRRASLVRALLLPLSRTTD